MPVAFSSDLEDSPRGCRAAANEVARAVTAVVSSFELDDFLTPCARPCIALKYEPWGCSS